MKLLHLLGTVRTSHRYWQKLISKNPDIEELEDSIKQALALPDEIRRSSHDAEVLLFYRILKQKRWVGQWLDAYPEIAIRPSETWREHGDRLQEYRTKGSRDGLFYHVYFRLLNAADYMELLGLLS